MKIPNLAETTCQTEMANIFFPQEQFHALKLNKKKEQQLGTYTHPNNSKAQLVYRLINKKKG